MTGFETAAGVIVGALFFVLVIRYAWKPLSTESPLRTPARPRAPRVVLVCEVGRSRLELLK